MLNPGRPEPPGWSHERLDALFAGLAEAEALVLAVSGGPDSIALLHLAASWSAAGRPRLHVATVDHRLRAEAAAEARRVASAAAALGLPHATLVWEGPKPNTAIQERARAARYGLLAAHARGLGARAVLTAHHADDQAETVLMRLARGSGVTGLAAMRRVTELAPGITLVRPLLECPKSALVALCRALEAPFVDDPSNADPRFERVRVRSGMAACGIERPALLRIAARMARAEAALEAEATRVEALITKAEEPCESGWRGDLSAARDATPEIVGRVVRRALRIVVGAEAVVPLDGLEAMADELHAALEARRRFAGTLAGGLVRLDVAGLLSVQHEPPRGREGGRLR